NWPRLRRSSTNQPRDSNSITKKRRMKWQPLSGTPQARTAIRCHSCSAKRWLIVNWSLPLCTSIRLLQNIPILKQNKTCYVCSREPIWPAHP
ncbi:hypothetical protein PMAYCL1PPCAC_21426, partial [Pristionchus mayeri]